MSGYAQWNPATTYPADEIVSYVSALWQSLQITTNNPPNTSPSFWAQVGGGGGVSSIVAGTGIAVSGTSAVTVSNTGVLSVASAGTGITIAGTAQNPTVQNTGVLSVSAGYGLSISGTAANPTLNNAGIVNVVAGTGIGVAIAPPETATITNNGVLALTAGSGVSITGTPANYTISATGSGGTLTGITAGDSITVTGSAPSPTVAVNFDTSSNYGVFLSSLSGTAPLRAQLNPLINNGTKVAPNGGGTAPTTTSLGGNSLRTTGYGFINYKASPQTGGNDLQTCIVYSDNPLSTPYRPIIGTTLTIFNNNNTGNDNMNYLIYYEDSSGNFYQFGNIQLSPQNIGYITIVQHNPDDGVNPLSCPYAWIFSKITNSGRYG